MPKLIDMTGWKMWEHGVPESKLEVIKRVENDKENKPQWLCKCLCGKFTIARGKSLKNGNTKSCGCLQKERASQNGEKLLKIHPGQRFGLLTVIKPYNRDNNNKIIWECLCDCGKTTYVNCSNLGRSTNSCGCNKHSIGELNILHFLKENNYTYIYDKPYFKDLLSPSGHLLRYDFIILENEKPCWIIEFDGR